MMKKVVALFAISGMLLACGQKKETKKQAEKPAVEKPMEWLTFGEGNTNGKHIVLISGDEEYRSEEALPQLAKILATHHGLKATVLFPQNPEKPGVIDPNYKQHIPGLEALTTADMLVVMTRFRALPDDQMRYIDDYLKAGKPVAGFRTATHAFNFNKDSLSGYRHYGNYHKGQDEWEGGFGRLVLGENWRYHHGHHKHESTRGILAKDAKSHPITKGIKDGDVWASADVYGVRLPLPGDAQPIILGEVMLRKGEYDETDVFYGMKPTDDQSAGTNKKGMKLNDPMMPVAWTKSYQIPGGKKGKAFTSTACSAADLLIEGTRRLTVNGILWAMDAEIPDRTNVQLVGEYRPSQYGFQSDAYWAEKQLKVADFQ